MSNTVQLGTLIEKAHLKYGDFESSEPLEAFGVSNTDGITQTAHRKSDDLSSYLVIEPGSFAYNPYRINVGSIGLTPEGLTGVVSPAYIVFKAKPGKLVPEVLLEFLKSKEGLRQINKLARGAVRKALRYDDLCEIEFPSIGYDQQLEILKSKIEFNKGHGRLESEITHQQTLLGKLKQAILQEAIQGKLTADWRAANPDVEPASELLQRIQAEKARLIAEKKIRKEKTLPEITSEEIPFEIPDGWEWCRLGHVGNASPSSIVDGPFGSAISTKRDYIDSGSPVTRMGNVSPFSYKASNLKFVAREKLLSLQRHNILSGDVLLGKVGSIGNACIYPDEMEEGLLATTGVARFRVGEVIQNDYLCIFLNARKAYMNSVASQTVQPFLNMGTIKGFVCSLPPLAEQSAIVERVEALMATCRELEAEIERSRTHAADLLQAVLKEAFAPAS